MPIEEGHKIIAANASRLTDQTELLATVQASLENDKAEDIVVIDLAGKSSIADYMVVASGTSSRHVGSMAEHLCQKFKAASTTRLSVEGATQGDWVLIDAGDVVVHLFRPEIREFYALEKLWESPQVEAGIPA
jgi:ribosome-associated protein